MLLVHESDLRKPKLVQGATVKCSHCHESVLADPECFRRHLSKAHRGITLEHYFKELASKEEDERLKKMCSDKKLGETCRVLVKKMEISKHPTGQAIALHNSRKKQRKYERSKFNKCKFQCPSCKKIFSTWLDMRFHRKEKSCVQCIPSQPGVTIKKASFKCLLCGKEELYDLFLFENHLRGYHSISNLDWYHLEVAGKTKYFQLEKAKLQRLTKKKKELRLSVPKVEPPLAEQVMPAKSLPDSLMTTTSVISICLFQCTTCNFEHDSWAIFARHLDKCIGGRRFSPAFVKEARYHKCGICAVCILSDENIISKHYKYQHNIWHQEEYLKACQDNIQKQMFKERGFKILNCSVSLERISVQTMDQHNTEDSAHETRRAPKTLHKLLDLSNAPVSNIIDDLCEFTCLSCGKRFVNMMSLQTHRQKGNPCEGKTITEPKTVSKVVAYKCLLCHRLLLCDRRVVSVHLRLMHRTKRQDYLAQTGQKYVDTGRIHRDAFEKIQILKRKVPTFPVLKHPVMPPSAVPRDKVTLEVENLCTFSCPKCGTSSMSFHAASRHRRACVGIAQDK